MTSVSRDELVATAWRLFATGGYTQTSIETIARELGTSKRTIYAHFGDKEELLEAGAQAALRHADAQARRILSEEAPPRTRFQRLVEWLTGHAQQTQSPVMADIRRGAPAVYRRIDQQRRAMIREHLSLVLAPAAGGDSGVTAEPERLAEVIAAAVAGVVARGEAEQDLVATAGDIAILLTIMTAGLYGPEENG
jgi:AcrR family transcriptional regulator